VQGGEGEERKAMQGGDGSGRKERGGKGVEGTPVNIFKFSLE